MLVWSRGWRAAVWAAFALFGGVVFAAPLGVVALASVTGQWNDVWPSGLTLAHYAEALSGPPGEQLRISLITAVAASGAALVCGTWAALALRRLGRIRGALGVLFFLPSAVPSVSVGLGLLVAFSQPPLLLNGTPAIVLAAHFVLVLAFTFASVTAGLARLPPEVEQMAQSLGARPPYVLWRVTLPMLAPYLVAAFSLSFALSMGELGATVMIYPPGWSTLPVGIFALTDRGDVFEGAALTMILATATLAVSLLAGRAAQRMERR